MVEGILNHDVEFIASGPLRSQSRESIGVRVEFAAVRPQREEQHSGIPLFDRGQLLIRRTVVREQPLVYVRAFCIVDMCQCADTPKTVSYTHLTLPTNREV